MPTGTREHTDRHTHTDKYTYTYRQTHTNRYTHRQTKHTCQQVNKQEHIHQKHTQTNTHANRHTYTQTDKYIYYSHSLTPAYKHIDTHSHTHSYLYTDTYTIKYTLAYMHRRTNTHTHAHTQIHIEYRHTLKRIEQHSNRQICILAYMYTYRHNLPHTQAHTYTQTVSLSFCPLPTVGSRWLGQLSGSNCIFCYVRLALHLKFILSTVFSTVILSTHGVCVCVFVCMPMCHIDCRNIIKILTL